MFSHLELFFRSRVTGSKAVVISWDYYYIFQNDATSSVPTDSYKHWFCHVPKMAASKIVFYCLAYLLFFYSWCTFISQCLLECKGLVGTICVLFFFLPPESGSVPRS